jgi:hypothetical protein
MYKYHFTQNLSLQQEAYHTYVKVSFLFKNYHCSRKVTQDADITANGQSIRTRVVCSEYANLKHSGYRFCNSVKVQEILGPKKLTQVMVIPYLYRYRYYATGTVPWYLNLRFSSTTTNAQISGEYNPSPLSNLSAGVRIFKIEQSL